jgi:hypothetical protein
MFIKMFLIILAMVSVSALRPLPILLFLQVTPAVSKRADTASQIRGEITLSTHFIFLLISVGCLSLPRFPKAIYYRFNGCTIQLIPCLNPKVIGSRVKRIIPHLI